MKRNPVQLLVMVILTLTPFLSKSQTLRILSYNIHHGSTNEGKMDLHRLAEVIREQQPDFVALQEVDSVCTRSGKSDIMQTLGRLTGMYYYFGKAMNYDGGGYGEGLLSKWPIEQIRTLALPYQDDKGREPRSAIEAVVKIGGKQLKIVATHLDHLKDPTDRIMQTGFLRQRYEVEPLPFIIAGDLNAPVKDTAIQNLLAICQLPKQDNGAPSFPAEKPTVKLDYILFSKNYPWKTTGFKVVDEQKQSDHRPVLATLKF